MVRRDRSVQYGCVLCTVMNMIDSQHRQWKSAVWTFQDRKSGLWVVSCLSVNRSIARFS